MVNWPPGSTMAALDDFDPIADASLCDEHEWAGYGDCPKCVAEHPEKYASTGDKHE